jgi:hypothetical protein
MSIKMIKEVRQVLGPLDPASGRPGTPTVARNVDLDRILSTTNVPSRRPAGRKFIRGALVARFGLVTAAVVATAAVVTAVTLNGPQSPAFAATPAALVTNAGDRAQPAADLLRKIAARTDALPALPADSNFEHLVVESWSLWTQIADKQVTSAVVPSRQELWRGSDDSGKVVASFGDPYFPSEEYRRAWQASGLTDDVRQTRTETFTAGRFPRMWKTQPPDSSEALKPWLATGHPVENGPAEVLVAVTDLARERVLGPQVRADLLRVLAETPGLSYEGTLKDRLGRSGEAVTLISDYTGLPVQYMLIVDPNDGRLLGFEQKLTTTAGKLNVKVPAVIGYEVFGTSELVGSIP